MADDEFHKLKPIKIQTLYADELKLYKYDNDWKRWRWVHNEENKVKKRKVTKTKMKIVSYNIWGALKDTKLPLFAFEKRSPALNKILEDEKADIIDERKN